MALNKDKIRQSIFDVVPRAAQEAKERQEEAEREKAALADQGSTAGRIATPAPVEQPLPPMPRTHATLVDVYVDSTSVTLMDPPVPAAAPAPEPATARRTGINGEVEEPSDEATGGDVNDVPVECGLVEGAPLAAHPGTRADEDLVQKQPDGVSVDAQPETSQPGTSPAGTPQGDESLAPLAHATPTAATEASDGGAPETESSVADSPDTRAAAADPVIEAGPGQTADASPSTDAPVQPEAPDPSAAPDEAGDHDSTSHGPGGEALVRLGPGRMKGLRPIAGAPPRDDGDPALRMDPDPTVKYSIPAQLQEAPAEPQFLELDPAHTVYCETPVGFAQVVNRYFTGEFFAQFTRLFIVCKACQHRLEASGTGFTCPGCKHRIDARVLAVHVLRYVGEELYAKERVSKDLKWLAEVRSTPRPFAGRNLSDDLNRVLTEAYISIFAYELAKTAVHKTPATLLEFFRKYIDRIEIGRSDLKIHVR